MLRKISIIVILLMLSVTAYAATSNEQYTTIPDKKNTHERGKVKMLIFFDFFCPHCHQFDTVVVPLLQREYGKRLQVTYTGFPILYEDSIIPIEAYELAKDEGKGEEMKRAIFDAIYYQRKDGANLDVLSSLAKSIGIDEEEFKERLTSGVKKKAVLEGKDLAKSYESKGTPTVIIDGNKVVKDLSLAALGSIINKILQGDKR